ncbi:MAG: 1-deoxy-D-xylulose-5-phosphate synthase [Pirellulaceae bacterium]|nr:1-deoxy-D-xylulose-5-phosphate synthase [Pirellulaceae bacterium]
MHELLSRLESAYELHAMSVSELEKLGQEIRDVLCNLLSTRTAHFASNLGVVELCLALHSVFDFRTDRLIWDTGHQIYPHKLVTGRYHEFKTIRERGGLMGYPNPSESEYDLFMTGHAGCSVSTALGLKSGDDLMQEGSRKSVAVIGDGALPSGIVFEALNNAGELEKDLIVILNDNKMSICPRVGAVANYLDRLRANPFYTGLKSEVVKLLNRLPVFGDPAERLLAQIKEGVKAGVVGGMLFEEFGFRYFGPVDGHDISLLRKYLQMAKEQSGPVLLHVVTEKGHGYQPAAADPVYFHTPPAFADEAGKPKVIEAGSKPAFTNFARDAILRQMRKNDRVTVMTAAMCQGNKLEPVRDEFPDRFFDVGICESHAVAFAAGHAKVGLRPIVSIYSTFMQRSYDQIFQEVALQNLPVIMMMDRAGLAGPDGPTHHGVFDIGYMRVFPNIVMLAPADSTEMEPMLEFCLEQTCPTSIRYPKATAGVIPRPVQPIELGKGETVRWGTDGAIVACGAMLANAVTAAEQLRQEGLEVAVINARFIKPLDRQLLARVFSECRFVVTVEEAALMGGFGSAVLELACQEGWETRSMRRLGIPDRFIEHGDRNELLVDLSLDSNGIAQACRQLAERFSNTESAVT